MATIKSLQKDFSKAYGKDSFGRDKFGGVGYQPAQIERFPTSIFQYDLASGGGYPRNKESIDYGPESSGKTLKAMKAIIYQQLAWPQLTSALFDIEGTYDPKWFARLGGDPTKLAVYRPDYIEQCADMCEALLEAEDCGLVVVDSVAAFFSLAEAKKSAEDELPGILARGMSKLVGRATGAMIRAERAGGWGTLVLINQTRTKIGVMYGDPESYPGGNKQRFASSLSNRMYGKNISPPSKKQGGDGIAMAYAKHHSCIIKKWKCPITSTHVEWETYTRPYDGKPVGYTGGWHDAEKILRDSGLLVQEKAGWTYGDATLKTLKEWETHFDANPLLRVEMVNRLLSAMDIELTMGEIPDEEFDKIDPHTGEVLEDV